MNDIILYKSPSEVDILRGWLKTVKEEKNHNNIETCGGQWFDLNKPDPAKVCITDIAEALSRLCRYAGNCGRFYSVAEHCCLCSGIAAKEGHSKWFQLACLIHDAPEAYIGDIVGPVKKYLLEHTTALREMEDRIYVAVVWGLGLHGYLLGTEHIVHEIDQKALAYEELCLMGSKGDWLPDDWPGKGADYGVVSLGWDSEKARKKFLENYEFLRRELEI